MATVSDFNAYFTRKYMIAGVVKADDPIECAQLYSSDTITEKNSYFRYQENAPSINYTNAIAAGYKPSYYASFQPGLEYIPEKYFTYKDLFPNGWNDTNDIEELVTDLVRNNWAFDAATGANFIFHRSIIDPNYRFYYDPDGFTLIPEITIFMSQGNSTVTGIKRFVQIYIHTLGYEGNVDPSTLIFGDSKGINYRSRSSQWMVPQSNGTYTPLRNYASSVVGYNGITGQSEFTWGSMETKSPNYMSVVPLSEALGDIKKLFEIFKKEKIYPAVNATRYDANTLKMYYEYSLVQHESAHPKSLVFLIDLSSCPHFPSPGFVICGTLLGHEAVDLDWTSGGPEANNPDITDDPNDEDPGHGPGQDPNDEGGDGDHDNTSDDIKPPAIPTLSASGAGLITIYNPSQSQLEALARSMWTPTALQAIKQYFTNPMDTILGLSIVPVQPKTASSREIMLGLYETGVTASLVDSDYVIVNCGSIMMNRYYGSYLDYSPYTKIKCYLPYIGEVDVNPDEVMTTSLMILYYVNVVTGDVVAMICSDGNILYTAAGNCIRQLPLSSADYASIINTAVSAVSGIAMAVATGGISSAGVAAAGAAKAATDETKKLASARATANNVGSANNLVGDVMNAKLNYKHAGSIGTGSGQLSYQKPYLIIERPNLDLASNYKSFVGYPCNKTLQIGKCTGFTQIEGSNLSVPNATDEEVAEIKELLLGGVII